MKTNALTLILFLIASSLSAQENEDKLILLDSLHNITTKNYFYTRVVKDYKIEKKIYPVIEYYKSGKISMTASTKNKDILQFEGLRNDYYENGNKKQQSNYLDNKLNGKQIDWYENAIKKSEKEIQWNPIINEYETKILQFWNPEGNQTVTNGNGQMEGTDNEFYEKGDIRNGGKEGIWEGKNIKRNYTYTEFYKNGKFVSGISIDENKEKHPYKELFQKPEPVNGIADFYEHIGKNYKTPNAEGLNGKIHIRFVVDKEGDLGGFKIIKDIGYGTGEEAIKAISSYGKWIPGKIKGIPAKVLYSIPILIKSSPDKSNYPSSNPIYNTQKSRYQNSVR